MVDPWKVLGARLQLSTAPVVPVRLRVHDTLTSSGLFNPYVGAQLAWDLGNDWGHDPVATLVSLAFWGFLWGLTGAFLAVPLTLIGMMICMRVPSARWVAVLLSNDGNPTFPEAPGQKVN